MKKNKKNVLKKLLLLFMAISTFGLHAQVTKVDSILKSFYGNKDILVASHRAAHQKYPENSIKAIEEAINLGVDIVELDLRQTKDGELIIMHDKTIDRTTNGKGEVSNLLWAELQKQNLLFNDQVTTEKIPTFEEVLRLTKGKILIDIDFKIEDENAVIKTYELIKKYSMENQVLFYIYDDYQHIPFLRNLNLNVKIMPRAYSELDVEKIMKYENINIIHVDEKFYKPDLMKSLINRNTRVWINSLGKYDKMEKELKNSGFNELLKKEYINVIQTDLPEELLVFLKANNFHK